MQQVGRSLLRCCAGTARVACRCRHPATRRRRFGVPLCSAALPWAGRWPVRGGRNTSGGTSAFRRARCRGLRNPKYRNAAASPRLFVGLASTVCWVWKRRVAFPLSARQRLILFGLWLPGSGPLHGPAAAAPCLGVVSFAASSFPCRDVRERRFQPRWCRARRARCRACCRRTRARRAVLLSHLCLSQRAGHAPRPLRLGRAARGVASARQ